jgi:rhodanese-related sulfurtransferase
MRHAAAAVTLAAALSACTPRPTAGGSSGAGPALPVPGVVSGQVARDLVEGGARIVDVRTPQEYAAGHVPGAVNIPFDQLGARAAAELGEPERPVVLYCRTGRRSGIAAETLRALGYGRVYDLQRYVDWPQAPAAGVAAHQ